jgi:integrase
LGSLSAVSLSDARTKAAECRALRQDGIDPIEARNAREAQAALDEAKAITFKQAAGRYIDLHRAGWKNAKHAAQWQSTLTTYAYPIIGALSVQAVDTALVCKVLEPIWTEKTETANRVRGRIETILDWAKVRGFRQGDNPARWRGHLEIHFPKRSKVRRVKHHPALPYTELAEFMTLLRQQDGVAAQALEFTILTAARTAETIGATRDEAKAADKVWTVSAERMKAEHEHRKPLSPRALTVLRDLGARQTDDDAFIFPGGKLGKPLSNMAMLKVIERMNDQRTAKGEPRFVDPKQNNADVTVHGFRSTFRDWAAERTNFPNEIVEMALAHAVEDKVEAAYRRGDLFKKRRRLMDAWGEFATKPAAAVVVQLRARNA